MLHTIMNTEEINRIINALNTTPIIAYIISNNYRRTRNNRPNTQYKIIPNTIQIPRRIHINNPPILSILLLRIYEDY